MDGGGWCARNGGAEDPLPLRRCFTIADTTNTAALSIFDRPPARSLAVRSRPIRLLPRRFPPYGRRPARSPPTHLDFSLRPRLPYGWCRRISLTSSFSTNSSSKRCPRRWLFCFSSPCSLRNCSASPQPCSSQTCEVVGRSLGNMKHQFPTLPSCADEQQPVCTRRCVQHRTQWALRL